MSTPVQDPQLLLSIRDGPPELEGGLQIACVMASVCPRSKNVPAKPGIDADSEIGQELLTPKPS